MNTETTDDSSTGQPLGLGSSEGLGPLPEAVQPIAYLYHDAETPQDAHPWLHSTMIVLAADRRPTLRNETPLVTLAQAQAMVAAERTKALHDAARWVDQEIGHALQEGWSVEAVQALMATRDMLKAHAEMQATTVEAIPSTDTPRWRDGVR